MLNLFDQKKSNLFKEYICLLFLELILKACGKKVVAFDVCSHPEIVKNGILVKKDDIEGFADAVVKLSNKNG